MCKTEEDALQQGRKISIKQPLGSGSKPLECFRGRGIRYWSNNSPRLPDETKIDETQQKSSKLKKGQLVELKNNCLVILQADGCAGIADALAGGGLLLWLDVWGKNRFDYKWVCITGLLSVDPSDLNREFFSKRQRLEALIYFLSDLGLLGCVVNFIRSPCRRPVRGLLTVGAYSESDSTGRCAIN